MYMFVPDLKSVVGSISERRTLWVNDCFVLWALRSPTSIRYLSISVSRQVQVHTIPLLPSGVEGTVGSE